MKKLVTLFCLTLLLINVSLASTTPILSIVPGLTQTYLRSDSMTVVSYTVTNNAHQPVEHLSIDTTFNSDGNSSSIVLQNNHCSFPTVLGEGESCTFQVGISGLRQPHRFIMSPRVCIYNGAVCSQPSASNRLIVTVNQVNGTPGAWLAAVISSSLPLQRLDINTNALTSIDNVFASNIFGGVAVSLDGRSVYTNQFNVSLAQVAIVDALSLQATNVYGSAPYSPSLSGVASSPDGSKVYITSIPVPALYVLDTASQTLSSIPLSLPASYTPAVSPDGRYVYITNAGRLSVVDTSLGQEITSVLIGSIGSAVTVSPDGTLIYATGSANNVLVIRASDYAVTNDISLPVNANPIGIAVSPDGKLIVTTDYSIGMVSFIDTSTYQVIMNVALGGNPNGVAFTPQGDRVYVTNSSQNYVSVINTSNFTVTNINVNQPQVSIGNFVG